MMVSWTALKAVLVGRTIGVHGTEDAENYYLIAIDGVLSFECILRKGNPNDDLIDFTTNYLPTWNQRLAPTVNGFPINRPATTKAGWHFAPRYITWTTALYDSMHNKKVDTTTDFGDSTLRFWKLSGTTWVELKRVDYASDLLFQAALLAECTITTMDWQTTYDFDIRGAVLINGLRPSVPTYGYVQAAPDLAPFGLSVAFLEGGIPLHLLDSYSFITNDALTVKSVAADAINNSNKLRVIIDHAVGAQHTMAIGYQHYKA